jgi:hypothetical protein
VGNQWAHRPRFPITDPSTRCIKARVRPPYHCLSTRSFRRGTLICFYLGFNGTSEQYAVTITNYSEHSKESYLHPGIHYRQLAQFLRSPSPGAPTGGNSRGTGSSSSRFAHVVIHHCSDAGQNKDSYDDETGLQRLTQLPPPEPDTGRLVFLRGHSSRSWLLQLGAQYRIDPEYFRRHLDFLQPRDFYDLPTLPSSSRNILQLRIVTICSREVPLTRDQIEENRREESKAVKRHQQKLGAVSALGESIVRKLSIHSESTFTLEQEVTVCIKKKSRGWLGSRPCS